MKTYKKAILLLLCAVILVSASVMGTVAFLKSQDKPEAKTLAVGRVKLMLDIGGEADPMMVPDTVIEKSAQVTVLAGSEACWLFVLIEESDNFGTYMDYAVAKGWETLDPIKYPGVIFCYVQPAGENQVFDIIQDGVICVNDDVTEADLAELLQCLDLSFTAVACQTSGFSSALDAWENIQEQIT